MNHMKPQPSDRAPLKTICGMCASGCGMRVTVRNQLIERIAPDKHHPAGHGKLCHKGVRARDIVHSPERLTRPLLKGRSGFEPVSWDTALDFIAGKISHLHTKYGGQALSLFKGHMPNPSVLDAFSNLMAGLGSPHSTGAAHLCHIPSYMGFDLVYGLKPYPVGAAAPDYAHTDCLVVWGTNPSGSSRISAATEWLRKFPAADKQLIVIDPYRTDAAEKANLWLQLRPGTDLAVGLAMVHVIIGENLYDTEFVKKWTIGFNRLTQHVSNLSPEWAQSISGAPAEKIRLAARTYAQSTSAAIDFGNGLDMHTNVVDTVRILGMLIALTGNLDCSGGNRFFPQPLLKPYPPDKPAIPGIGRKTYPLFPATPFPAVVDDLNRGDAASIKVMLVYHGNPALSMAHASHVRNALKNLDLLVVVDMFNTATADLAHVVLPETSSFERIGFKTHADHNGGYLIYNRPVIPPVGRCRPWYDIEYELATRLNLTAYYPWTSGPEWVSYRIQPSGVSLDKLDQDNYIQVRKPAPCHQFDSSGMTTPSGLIELYSDKLEKLGLNPLPGLIELEPPVAVPDNAEQMYPLLGTTRRPGTYIHSRYRNIPSLRKHEPRATIRLHPETAAQRGIAEGEKVRVVSARGSACMHAMLTDKTHPEVVVMDFGWGNPGDGGENVNKLTDDDIRDPISASTANRRFACQVEKISEESS